MKCIDAEKCLPLYVRSDLGAALETLVAAHLQSCDQCRGRANEYKDVQQWMRLYEPPEFNSEFFDRIRHNVLSAINKASAPVGWIQLLSNSIYRKWIIATSIALLIITSGVALYVRSPGQSRTWRYSSLAQLPINPSGTGAENPANSNTLRASADDLSTLKKVPLPGKRNRLRLETLTSRAPVAGSTSHNIFKAEPKREQVSKSTLIQISIQDGKKPEAPPIKSEPSTLASVTPKEALRIEMQTLDPNIRIIWFVPRENTVK